MLEINTLPRQAKEKTNVGFIPAVYYGAHTPATSIFINAIEFTKVFASAGESSTVTLKTEKGNETVLIQAVQKHPVKSHVIHVDFYVLEKGRVAETGNHQQLLEEKGLYYAMWRQQIGERKMLDKVMTVS